MISSNITSCSIGNTSSIFMHAWNFPWSFVHFRWRFLKFFLKKIIQVVARKPARLCQAVWNLNGAQRIRNTVDGSDIRDQLTRLRLVVLSYPHYLQGFYLAPSHGGCLGFLNHQQYQSNQHHYTTSTAFKCPRYSVMVRSTMNSMGATFDAVNVET